MRKLRNGAIALGLISAGGAFAGVNIKCSMEEGDLTKVGNGMPSIVQINDPQCPCCQALRDFDGGELQYL